MGDARLVCVSRLVTFEAYSRIGAASNRTYREQLSILLLSLLLLLFFDFVFIFAFDFGYGAFEFVFGCSFECGNSFFSVLKSAR